MHVCADHVAEPRALGVVGAVVAGTVGVHAAQGLGVAGQEGLPGMVFVADDVAKFLAVLDQIADHAVFAAHGVRTEDTNAVEPGAVHGFEILAEQLVQAADHEHRHAVRGERTQGVRAGEQVVCDFLLPVVLSAAAENQVHMFRPRVALVVFVENRVVAVQRQPAHDGEHVAPISVDVHILRVQGHDVDAAARTRVGLGIRKVPGCFVHCWHDKLLHISLIASMHFVSMHDGDGVVGAVICRRPRPRHR